VWGRGVRGLHENALRLLGVDITGAPEERRPYIRAAMEALRGLFTEEAYQQIHAALAGDQQGNDAGDR
jgi:TetR/AcrR family transcriptional regulator, regulator of cefoperazone and chloramphenicol sensitivity